ncbi:MAG: LCP family protein [Christensenellales bacterium]|jgi:LCP family protein required for cell wall assembly
MTTGSSTGRRTAIVLLLIILILALLAAVFLFKGSLQPLGYNVLIIGTDARGNERGRADTIMLVSYNTFKNNVSMVSLQRDILVDIEGHGKNRLNAAYAYGGAELLMKTINSHFDLNVSDYVIVTFDSVKTLVNGVGGVDVALTQAEADYLNSLFGSGYSAGVNHLSGEPALEFSRLRQIGTDSERTRRQRDVVFAAAKKVRSFDSLSSYIELYEEVKNVTDTNVSLIDVAGAGLSVMIRSDLNTQSMGIPVKGSWKNLNYNGAAVLDIDFDANTRAIHDALK